MHEERYEEQLNLEQTDSRIKLDITREYYSQITDEPVVIDILSLINIARRIPVEAIVGQLLNYGEAQYIADIISALVDSDYIKYEYPVLITKQEQVDERLSTMFHALPMLIEPVKIKSNSDTGYLTYKESIVTHSSIKEDVCLDVINILNSQPLRLLEVTILPKEGSPNFSIQKEAFNHLYKDKPMYLTHFYDSRGRVYCKGYHYNYQSTEDLKAEITFY